MEKYWNQQSNFFIYTSFHLVHQKWQFAVAILSGVTPFLLYHSTDIVLIEKNHLVQLKKAFLSDHNKWSYASNLKSTIKLFSQKLQWIWRFIIVKMLWLFILLRPKCQASFVLFIYRRLCVVSCVFFCPSHLQITGSVNLQICNFISLFFVFLLT